jgi:FkbM family methyltransferase
MFAVLVASSLALESRLCTGVDWVNAREFVNQNCTRVPGASIERVDIYSVDGKRFFWPWKHGNCGGVEDFNWHGKRGDALEHLIAGEVNRLRQAGVADGGVRIDIGAHAGDSTIAMALFANKTIAFDPNPTAIGDALEAVASLNPEKHIDVWRVGVADKDGTIAFEYGGLCNGGVAGHGAGGGRHALPVVQLMPFLVKRYGESIIGNVSFIKIDVEGYDMHLLRLLTPMIAKIGERKCPMVQIEWFEFFRNAPGGAKNVALFDVIYGLPGKWTAVCASALACGGNVKNAVGCARQQIPQLAIHGPHDPKRNGCKDLMLVPILP